MEKHHQKLVSVVMPCYNSAAYVQEAITSALRQTHPNVEVIVVDDGSDDGSTDIVRQLADTHPGRVVLLQQHHSGPYPARNLGLQHVRGEYVAFLDADDWWSQDFLKKLLFAMLREQADLAYCGWQNTGNLATNDSPYIPPAYENEDTVSAFLRGCPWPIHAALVRRSILNEVKGFSERCYTSMDYDIWLRILGKSRKITRVPEVLAYYRWHGSGQISATKWKQVLDAIQVRRDFVNNHTELVSHLSPQTIYELIDRRLLKEAYRAYWKSDFPNAQQLFRKALASRVWQLKDLKYLIPALLPPAVFQRLAGLSSASKGDS